MATTPRQKPGRSKQDYQTPPAFLAAVKRYLGITHFAVDLAASASNTAAPRYYSIADDSLVQDWRAATDGGWGWLNQPFAHIEPWVKKAFVSSASKDDQWARVAQLVPAGVGANWWRKWVHQKAHVLLLNGRLTFVGEAQGYPKDCCLLLWSAALAPGYHVWTWPTQLIGGGDGRRDQAVG